MTNSDFDKKIQDVFAEAEMPFSEDNWARMQQRLDKKSPRKLLFLPLLYKPYAAAALLAAAASLYFFTRNTDTGDTSVTSALSPVTYTTAPVNPVDTSIAQDNNLQAAHIATHKYDVVITPHKPAGHVQEILAVQDTVTSPAEEIAPAGQPVVNSGRENLPVLLPHYVDERIKRKITFGVNTGMAIYESQNSFAGGFMVKRYITSRVAIHAGLGFVQNRQSASVKHTVVTETPVVRPSDTSLGITTVRTETEYYEQYSKNLPFIQFNPGLSVLVVKRLTGTVGADVQRILIGNNMLDTINKHLAAEGKKVAGIDAGLTLSVNYSITKNIGLGLSYRNSLMGMSAGQLQHVKRNYILVQLQYIFNAQ